MAAATQRRTYAVVRLIAVPQPPASSIVSMDWMTIVMVGSMKRIRIASTVVRRSERHVQPILIVVRENVRAKKEARLVRRFEGFMVANRSHDERCVAWIGARHLKPKTLLRSCIGRIARPMPKSPKPRCKKMLLYPRNERIEHRHFAVTVVFAILAIMSGCDSTTLSPDGNATVGPPEPTPNGDGDGIEPATVVLDDDGDGVVNSVDVCPTTPAGVATDAVGCSTTESGIPDMDQDGVSDENDTCGETPPGSTVNSEGCAESQRDTDGDGLTDDKDNCDGTPPQAIIDSNGCSIAGDECGNGIIEVGEQCDPPNGTSCSQVCRIIEIPPIVCGNSVIEPGETCDDGNTTPGDGCDATCRKEVLHNDHCTSPLVIGDGTTPFDSTGASTDGPEEPEQCAFSASAKIESDVWFCYESPCNGMVVASLCGSQFDTKMAVYAGCDCPSSLPIGCSDDDCGSGVFDSRVAFQAVAGQSYMIRVGGFEGEQGDGILNLSCGADSCSSNAGDCYSANDSPGCRDQECCVAICEVDAFCCDVAWDDFCSREASGVCTGNYAACGAGSGDCKTANGSPGCDTEECCSSVCGIDPFCCVGAWDEICASEAASPTCR